MPIFISFLVPRAIAKPCTSRRGGRGANEGRHRALVQRTQCLGCKGWEKGRQFLPAARCHGDGRARAAASMNTHELGEPGGCTHCALNAKAPARPRSTKSCDCARDRRRPTAVSGNDPTLCSGLAGARRPGMWGWGSGWDGSGLEAVPLVTAGPSFHQSMWRCGLGGLVAYISARRAPRAPADAKRWRG